MRESLRFRLRDDDRAPTSVAAGAHGRFGAGLALVAEDPAEPWPSGSDVLWSGRFDDLWSGRFDELWPVRADEQWTGGTPVGSGSAWVDRPG